MGFLLTILLASNAYASEVSVTIDDFSIHDGPKLTLEKRDEEVLKALAKHKVKAGLFIRCAALEDSRVKERLQHWDKAGHLLANHTYNHWSYNKTEFSKFSEDIKKCDDVLKHFKNFAKLFRFPYLKGGKTVVESDRVQKFLSELGYQNGYVTIDTSDWFISDKLEKKLRVNPKASLKPYRDYYLAHMWDRAQYYEELSKKHWKKPVPHTILMHHNLLNSLFLDDLLAMFKEKGWKLVDARTAFQDPIFTEIPKGVPAGESITWSLAKAAGDTTLRMPGEDSAYEEKAMQKLGL